MADAKTREQLEQEWWDSWWAEDFSWAGLANKPVGKNGDTVHGGLHGEQSLQEYWRRDPASGAVRDDTAMQVAGELVDCDGMLFHMAHLPPKTKTGAPTWKADLKHENWARLEAPIIPRLSAIADTKINAGGAFEGPDGRTQLAGCVLRGAISHKPGDVSPLYFNALGMAALGDADYSNHQFGPHGAEFGGVLFAGSVSFKSANFNTGVRFKGASFSGGVSFDSATFSGDAIFHRATFYGNVTFFSASFSGDASFVSATFSAEASFDYATFSGDARFLNAIFFGDARFQSATFSGEARFYNAIFSGYASFQNATFSGVTRFYSAIFSGDARFDSAIFSENASFQSATFSGEARLYSATFSGNASFQSATFSGYASFDDTKFNGKAYFQVKAFQKAVAFNRCQFAEPAWFDAAHFGGDMDFTATEFAKPTSFERLIWPEDARHWHSAFDQASFRDNLVLTGAGFRAFAAFDGATLERGVQIDDPETEKAANDRFRAERRAAIASAKLDGAEFESRENERRRREDKGKTQPVKASEVRDNIRKQREERLRQLERGCRVLKQAMEYSSNKTREQMLYRFELQARRAQKNLPPGEKLFSDLYALTSGYGASMVRPFMP